MRVAIRFSLALLWASSACVVIAALHDQVPGSDVPVHYVHLTGHGGDNEINLKNLKETYQACVTTHMALSKPYQPQRADAMPPIVAVIDAEIYYAANRTLTVQHGVLHSINPENCGVEATHHHVTRLQSSIGRCDMDMVKKETKGICDADAHAKAPYRVVSRPGLPDAAGETQLVLNTRCQMHRNPLVAAELCVANPASGQDLSPYPIPASHLNAGIPGVLMEVKSPALTLTAQQIHWNMAVSAKLFGVPADVTVRPSFRAPR